VFSLDCARPASPTTSNQSCSRNSTADIVAAASQPLTAIASPTRDLHGSGIISSPTRSPDRPRPSVSAGFRWGIVESHALLQVEQLSEKKHFVAAWASPSQPEGMAREPALRATAITEHAFPGRRALVQRLSL
jgi:hypothetical protein